MRTRHVVGLAVALLGALYALLCGGGTVMGCLGPLNVTAVRCAARGGRLPPEGPWVGIAVAAVGLGALIAIQHLRASRVEGLAAAVGLALGAAAYFARRPTALEGPDYDGTWLVVPLPVEGWTLLWWAVAGMVAMLTAVSFARLRDEETE